MDSRGPIGVWVHLTRDQKVGMKIEGYGTRMRNVRPLRHMLRRNNDVKQGILICFAGRLGRREFIGVFLKQQNLKIK